MDTIRSLPPPPCEIDVVIVAWNHGDTLPDCVASIAAADRSGWTLGRVVVVDNASTTPAAIAAPSNVRVTIVRNHENVGFALACNQGAAGSPADGLVFLNPDCRLGRHSLRDAVAAMAVHPALFAVGLPLVDYAGNLQATCGPPLSARRLFNQVVGLARLAPGRFAGMRLPAVQHDATRQVGFASGAALLVRRPMFDAVGRFDPRFVVYLEDADLCARAAARGWPTWLVAGDPVVHRGGWGTGRDRGWRLAQSWRSTIRYAGKHFGPAGRAAVVAGVLLLAPLARVAAAAARAKFRECAEIAVAYRTLLRMITEPPASDRSLPTGRPSLRRE